MKLKEQILKLAEVVLNNNAQDDELYVAFIAGDVWKGNQTIDYYFIDGVEFISKTPKYGTANTDCVQFWPESSHQELIKAAMPYILGDKDLETLKKEITPPKSEEEVLLEEIQANRKITSEGRLYDTHRYGTCRSGHLSNSTIKRGNAKLKIVWEDKGGNAETPDRCIVTFKTEGDFPQEVLALARKALK